MRLYRIVKAARRGDAFDGMGAKLYGGRWNSRGVPVVYAADSPALAALEILVHLRRSELLGRYALLSVEMAEPGIMLLAEPALPADWRRQAPPASTQAVGDAWALGGESMALAVPSVLVPIHSNYLLNPAHPQFGELLGTLREEPFDFDSRLVKSA